MKIILVVHIFFPQSRAGTEVYTLNLARALKKHGHDVSVVCYEQTEDAPSVLIAVDDWYEGLPVHRIRFDKNQANILLYEYFNPQVEKHLVEFYARVRPDIVHVMHSMHLSAAAITAALRLGLHVVCTVTDFWYICPTYRLLRVGGAICPGPVNFLECIRCYALPSFQWDEHEVANTARLEELVPVLRKITLLLTKVSGRSWPTLRKLRDLIERPDRLRDILRRADVLIVPNENTYKVLTDNGITAKRVRILGFGLPESVGPHMPKSRSGKLRLAYIGTLDHAKGPHIALEALRHLPELGQVELTIYGDTQSNPDYFLRLQKIAGSDPRIRFAGTFPNEQIGTVFSEIDLLVIPSLWYENTPLVLLSAFASKTPVVVSNVGSLAESVFHGENGLLFEVGNPEDLARQIQMVVQDRFILEKLREGVPQVKSIDQNAKELLELYVTLSADPEVASRAAKPARLSKWLEVLRSDG